MTNARRPQILFVTRYLPALNGGGTQQRAQTIIEALSAIGDVHVFLHDFDTASSHPVVLDEPFRPMVKSICRAAVLASEDEEVWASQLSPSPLSKLLRLAWVTTGRMNPATAAQTKAIVTAVRAQTQNHHFDIVFALQAHCAMLVTDAMRDLLAPGGMSLLDWDAAEALAIRESTRQLPRWRAPLAHLRGFWNAIKLQPFEDRLLKAWDAALCASPVDTAYFKSRAPDKLVYCLANAVTIPDLGPSRRETRSASPQVVFVASLNYWPNHQGAMLFLNEIWPRVRSALPDAEIRFVGRGPSSDLLMHDGKNGITVEGEVESVAPYYEAADVAIAPMIFSVGSAIKVLEALAYRKPMVGFKVAIFRHGLKDGEHVAVANTPGEFADKLVTLLKDPEARERLASVGHEYVVDKFSRPKIVEGLQKLILNARSVGV